MASKSKSPPKHGGEQPVRTSNKVLESGSEDDEMNVQPPADGALENNNKVAQKTIRKPPGNATEANDAAAGQGRPKKQKMHDDSVRQYITWLVQKSIAPGFQEGNVSEITNDLVIEIEKDPSEKRKFQEDLEAFETMKDDTAWVTQRIGWGSRLFMRAQAAQINELKELAEAQAAQIYATSIERWIRLSKMDYSSKPQTELDMKLKRAPGSKITSHVYTRHKTPTKIEENDFKLDDMPILPKIAGGRGHKLTSLVMTKFENKKRSTFTNEASVSLLVGLAIMDAVAYMDELFSQYSASTDNHHIELDYRTECSMFSNKPDHYVILVNYQKFQTVFPVEVKKDHEKVFTSSSVGAQVCDYTMLQKMLTGQPSLAVLTTFNQSKIVWDPDCNNVAKTEGRLKKVETTVKSVINTMERSNPPPPPPLLLTNGNGDGDDFKTPEANTKSLQNPRTVSPPEVITEPRNRGADDTRRLMYSKQTYEPRQLLSVLCNVAIASLNKGLDTIKIQTGKLHDNQTILVLKEQKEKPGKKLYEWRTQSGDVKVDDSLMDFNDNNKEYLVRTLVGVGSTSRCWGAVVIPDKNTPQKGFSCVIKYWIKIWNEDNNKYYDEDHIAKESNQTTGKEVENYENIYGNIFFTKENCRVAKKKLNNTYCVILPFFEPIAKDEREGVLDEVRNVLSTRFYNKVESKSYRFKESDQGWRHIGRWTEPGSGKNHLVLFDLADLDEIENATEVQHKDYVDRHITTLSGKAKHGGSYE
jgi:hypothetical protein